jgi:transcriptional regulator with XRE-family HTH domain
MQGLSERLQKLGANKPRGWQAELAQRCGVKAPSVTGWLTGDSKKMDAQHLFAAADYFGVNPRWLAFGVGVKAATAESAQDVTESATAEPLSQEGANAELAVSVIPISMAYSESNLYSTVRLLGSLLGALDQESREHIAEILRKVALEPDRAEILARRAVANAFVQERIATDDSLNKKLTSPAHHP